MKSKLKKLNKPEKIVITILIIISVCFCFCKVADKVSYPYVKTKAEIYLCHKYDAKISEIEMLDYKHAKTYWEDYQIFLSKLCWTDFSFEFKYNDRTVVVNRENGKFYDDYQLEDIENWSTDWLQKNVDDRIVGVEIDSTDIYWYQKYTKKGHNYIFTVDDTEEFLNYNTYNNDRICTFYYLCNTDDGRDMNVNDDILSKLHKKLVLNKNINVSYTSTQMIKFLSKSDEDEWTQSYITYAMYNNLNNN